MQYHGGVENPDMDWASTEGDERAGDASNEVTTHYPENLRMNFLCNSLAAPECGGSAWRATSVRGVGWLCASA